jgi:hypothetical protein
VDDNISGVPYRVGAKGWMDRRVIVEMTMENGCLWRLSGGKKRILYLDNCGGHNSTEAAKTGLARMKLEVRFLRKIALT